MRLLFQFGFLITFIFGGMSVYALISRYCLRTASQPVFSLCSIFSYNIPVPRQAFSKVAKMSATVSQVDDFRDFIQKSPYDNVPLNVVLDLSRRHCAPFPVETARLHHLLKDGSSYREQTAAEGRELNSEVAESYVNSAYPIIHEKLFPLLVTFLNYKKENSTQETERTYYKDKNVFDLVNRLLKNRPVAFLTNRDSYLLPNGRTGLGGFEAIGTGGTKTEYEALHDLSLEEFISYDEMRLSALVSASTRSPFINKGDRFNVGRPGMADDHELDGVIVGQVGARFEKPGLMDWQDIMVYKKQNSINNGYGINGKEPRSIILKAWANLWGVEYLPTMKDIQSSPDGYKKHRHQDDCYFSQKIYKTRIQMMAEVLLIEASSRATEVHKKAYIHVVGLGLGVWQTDQSQPELYIEAWADAIASMPDKFSKNISYIDFSWITPPRQEIRGVPSGGKFPNTDITVVFSKRNLHDKVPDDCILVCNYAWDSNSAPGNEYWMRSLTASGDPAAACSSSIAELHNARINPRMSAQYLRIASMDHGIMTVPQYLELRQKHEQQQQEEEEAQKKKDCDALSSFPAMKPSL